MWKAADVYDCPSFSGWCAVTELPSAVGLDKINFGSVFEQDAVLKHALSPEARPVHERTARAAGDSACRGC